MQCFKWDPQINCKRYHCTLNASVCLIRFRIGIVAGCQKCEKGQEIESLFGKCFDQDNYDTKLIKRTANSLRSLVFKS